MRAVRYLVPRAVIARIIHVDAPPGGNQLESGGVPVMFHAGAAPGTPLLTMMSRASGMRRLNTASTACNDASVVIGQLSCAPVFFTCPQSGSIACRRRTHSSVNAQQPLLFDRLYSPVSYTSNGTSSGLPLPPPLPPPPPPPFGGGIGTGCGRYGASSCASPCFSCSLRFCAMIGMSNSSPQPGESRSALSVVWSQFDANFPR